jgi:hypothetical protein
MPLKLSVSGGFLKYRITGMGTVLSVATGKTVIQINSQINVGNLHNTSH